MVERKKKYTEKESTNSLQILLTLLKRSKSRLNFDTNFRNFSFLKFKLSNGDKKRKKVPNSICHFFSFLFFSFLSFFFLLFYFLMKKIKKSSFSGSTLTPNTKKQFWYWVKVASLSRKLKKQSQIIVWVRCLFILISKTFSIHFIGCNLIRNLYEHSFYPKISFKLLNILKKTVEKEKNGIFFKVIF